MKFMKIGSKPDTFKTEGDNARFVANELASDIIVNVTGAKFYLHKFPLLSKCASLQKLLASKNEDKVDLSDIPGGISAFEICAKFCYGMTVTLNAYNVVSARCAAEYLGMHETIEKGNLAYKIDVFLSSGIFRSWKDSIIVLQTTKSFLPLSEELQLASLCIDAIAARACVDVSRVDWSYTYNRKKLPEENGNDPNQNGLIRNRNVPRDWWVEDLCDLEIGFYKRVITNIKSKGLISDEVIGEALKAYAYRKLSGFKNGMVLEDGDLVKYKPIVDTLVWLLPGEKGSVSCSFLLKLLKAAIFVGSGMMVREQLVKRIGQQLQEASVTDLLIPSQEGDETLYDVGIVRNIVREFVKQDQNDEFEVREDGIEVQEMRKPGILSEASKLMVAKLVDGYLAEIAKDPNLSASRFAELAEMVSGVSRPAHDGLYRAIDRYLKEHPGINKSEKKRICNLMDCRKLSADACMHAVQNERLPLRVVVQVLFFEQVRAAAAASSGSSTPDLPKIARELGNCGSHGSARSVPTNMDDEWDAVATAEELKALKGEIAALRLGGGGGDAVARRSVDKAAMSKVRGLIKSRKIFGKLLSSSKGRGGGGGGGGGGGEHSGGSDSSESLGSVNHPEEVKSTPLANRRASVS